MTGVVTRDSAQRRPSDKHRSDARNFLPHRRPLVPRQADRLAAVPCPVLPDHRPIPEPGRRGGHSPGCTNTALIHSISTEIFIETAPHSALVLENAAEVSNQATVATVTARQSTRQGHQLAPEQPVALDEVLRLDTTTTAPFPASWPRSCPAGPSMAGTSVPAMDNLFAADSAVSPKGPQRQRRTRAAG